jgi:glycosyltransferase involved in cell wall biosynthesis
MKTIGLCMIVKNEARIILRCLESARPLIDYVLIEDTGSTDGTQDLIRDYLKREGLPGEVFDEPWRDFAYNRSLALARLREKNEIDYALVMDADDVLVYDDGFDAAPFKANLTADLYLVELHHGVTRHHRPQMCSNRLEFQYRGIVHEFLESPKGAIAATARGFHINPGVEGARSQDPDKYRKDALVLEKALETEEDPFLRSRYRFYMAQSWRDAGENEKALAGYLARAELGYWKEEIFVSLYNAARLKEALGHPDHEIIGMYLRAYEICPHRAESLHGAARYCRLAGKFHQGYMIGKQAVSIPQPKVGLFIEPWIYDYGLLDELAVNAYWVGRYDECSAACERLLREGKIPAAMRSRVETNARLAEEKSASLQNEKRKSCLGDASNAPAISGVPAAVSARGIAASRFTVLLRRPPGYAHAEALNELAETLLYGLARLGYDARLASELLELEGQTIVIAPHLLSDAEVAVLPPAVIFYNVEHFSRISAEMPKYIDHLRSHEVWDYSQDNAQRLAMTLGREVKYVPIGFVDELLRIPKRAVEDIDVLFYGSLNARRETILAGLRSAGINVHHAFGVYGTKRDELISRAKVVLNMHYYEPGVFEAVRVSYLLANQKAVVVEFNPGELFDSDLEGAVARAPYDGLILACVALLTDVEKRKGLERRGFDMFRSRDEMLILNKAIGLHSKPGNHPTQHIGVIQSARTGMDCSSLYLDLMTRCLLNTIYEDVPFDPWNNGQFDSEIRRKGRDWPSRAHTMIGELRLNNFRSLIEKCIREGVPGDIIETGVWRGGACIMARAVLKAYNIKDRCVWVADSFAGLPPPDPAYPMDRGDRHFEKKQLAVSLEEVQSNFRKYGLLDDQVRFLKGWFKDTLFRAPINSLAVLRLDGDMYQSTMDALTALYDKLEPNGFIIIDDFGAVAGCRQAVMDFRAQRSIRDPIVDIDGLGVYWRKVE